MAKTNSGLNLNISIFSFITLKDKVFLARQLATMLAAGLPVDQSFRVLANQMKNPKLKEIYIGIFRDIESGKNLSYALGKYPNVFDSVFVAVVRSGEGSGQLDQVLLQLADRLESTQDFNSKVKAALMYPFFVFLVMIVITILMMIYVVPPLKSVFDQSNTALPFTTQVVISMSNFTVKFWWIEVAAMLGIFIGMYYYSKTETGGSMWDNLKIKFPIIKDLYVQLYMARFCRTLSMLTQSGVQVIEALAITSDVVQNRVYAKSIRNVIAQVERGIPISAPLYKDKNFPAIVPEMMMVGEQTGQAENIMLKLAEYYERETSNMIKGLSGLIEPIIIIVLGIAVGFLVISMVYPIYSLSAAGFGG